MNLAIATPRPVGVEAVRAIEDALRKEPERPRVPLLAAREHTHGNFDNTARIAQRLKTVMRDTVNWGALTEVQQEVLEGIATKTRANSVRRSEPQGSLVGRGWRRASGRGAPAVSYGEEDLARIAELWAQRLPTAEIGRRLNVPKNSICRLARDARLKGDPRFPERGDRRPARAQGSAPTRREEQRAAHVRVCARARVCPAQGRAAPRVRARNASLPLRGDFRDSARRPLVLRQA